MKSFFLPHSDVVRELYVVVSQRYPQGGRWQRIESVLYFPQFSDRSDLPRNYAVHIFCPMCRDIFTPRSSRSASVDGAFFGTTFPHLFLMTFPELIPQSASHSFVIAE